MPVQPIALAAQLAASLLLAFVFVLLARHDPRPYLRQWSAAWVAQALAVAALLTAPGSAGPRQLHAGLLMAYALLVAAAARSYSHGSPALKLPIAAAAVLAWAAATPALFAPHQFFGAQRFLLALAHGAAAVWLWPLREPQAMGLRLTTNALALRALVDAAAAIVLAAQPSTAMSLTGALLPSADLLLQVAIGLGLSLTIADAAQFALATTHQQLTEAERRLKVLSETDGLTGCFNRRVFRELVDDLRSSGHAQHGVIVLADIEALKAINERDGHAAGDDVLRRTAEAIRSRTRATDIVVRWDGDEFLVVIPGAGRAEGDARRTQLGEVIAEARLPVDLAAAGYGPGIDILVAVEEAERGVREARAERSGRALET